MARWARQTHQATVLGDLRTPRQGPQPGGAGPLPTAPSPHFPPRRPFPDRIHLDKSRRSTTRRRKFRGDLFVISAGYRCHPPPARFSFHVPFHPDDELIASKLAASKGSTRGGWDKEGRCERKKPAARKHNRARQRQPAPPTRKSVSRLIREPHGRSLESQLVFTRNVESEWWVRPPTRRQSRMTAWKNQGRFFRRFKE